MPTDTARAAAARTAMRREMFGGRDVGLLPLRLAKAMTTGRTPRRALAWLRACELAEATGRVRLADWMRGRMERLFGYYIHPRARIGPGLKLPRPIGIVIGAGVEVGAGCTIFQHVTLGGARFGDSAAREHPRIGDGVALFAGAKILGRLDIGDGASVGANAIVTRDVHAGHVAAHRGARGGRA